MNKIVSVFCLLTALPCLLGGEAFSAPLCGLALAKAQTSAQVPALASTTQALLQTPAQTQKSAQVQAEAQVPVQTQPQAESPLQTSTSTSTQTQLQAQIPVPTPTQAQVPAQAPTTAQAQVKEQTLTEAQAQLQTPTHAQITAQTPAKVQAQLQTPTHAQITAQTPAKVQVQSQIPAQIQKSAQTQVSAQPLSLYSVQLFDRQGRELRSFLSPQETYSEPVALSAVSPWFVLAVVAAEDRRFYTHHGVDWRAVLRAMWQNIRGGGVVSGASTITQQLVRLRSPRPKTLWGKIREAWDAWNLERKLSKEEILQEYVNRVELGQLTQGVQSAALFYFDVPASDLSLAQAALLAGVIQAPSRLNPVQNPKGALLRRGRVLQAMYKNGSITQEQYQQAMKEPLGLSLGERPFSAPHFVRRVYEMAPQTARVYTTLDKDLQLYAQRAVQNHLSKLKDNNVTNAAVVVLDNNNGGVLAYVGSADFYDARHSGQVDGVAALRQPGSSLKPFVYALALQNGLTAASILDDEDTFFEGGFRPRNYDEKFHGGVPLRRALACSYNVPAVKAAEPLGAARLLNLLHELGFASLNKAPEFYGLGLALGGGEVTLLELANAYAALARGGVLAPVLFSTQPQIVWGPARREVLPADISYVITDILSDNAARADAFGLNSALHFTFPAAAKTGTSKDYRDNFAVGYTPRLTVAVWAGNFDASSMQKVSGISGAAPIMHDVLLYAQRKYPAGAFAVPEGITRVSVCEQSGLLAGPACTHTREEVFVPGTVPQQVCDGTHQSISDTLQITFPVAGDVYKYDPALPAAGQQLHFKTAGAQEPCRWRLNAEELPSTKADWWWPLEKGDFVLEVSCGGQEAQAHFKVL